MNVKVFMQRHPVITYFGLVYLISYGGFFVVVGPKLPQGEAMQPTDTFLLFLVIVVGVCLVGIALTGIVDGRSCLRLAEERIAQVEQRIPTALKAAIQLLTNLVQCVKVYLSNAPLVCFSEHSSCRHAFARGLTFWLPLG
jgi:hypothetical protein